MATQKQEEIARRFKQLGSEQDAAKREPANTADDAPVSDDRRAELMELAGMDAVDDEGGAQQQADGDADDITPERRAELMRLAKLD